MTGRKTVDSDRWRWNRWRFAARAAAVVLLLSLLAMRVTGRIDWDAADFAILGAFLLGAVVAFELAARKTHNTSYRAAVGVALAAAFILAVVNGAVGVIGTEHDDANLMFGGVLAIGIIGAFIARFQPRGMARALLATSISQVLAAVIALAGGFGSSGPIWPLDILFATGIFTSLWLVAAILFRNAARLVTGERQPRSPKGKITEESAI